MFELRKIWMPYGMSKMEDGTWRMFNRQYAPMGPPIRFVRKLAKATIANISVTSESPMQDTLWFYNDACAPTDSDQHWDAYSTRLKALAKLQVKD